MAVSADGTVKKLPNKKNFVLKIPDSYYREYDAAAQDKALLSQEEGGKK